MKDLTLPLFSFLSGRKINLAAKEIFQDIHIEDLWLPFFCVSTNLTLASAVIHRRGLLLNAIRASCAVPGLVPPVIQNNEILVDGGIMNNMPVEIARGLFKGKVIAVDVTDARVLSTLRQEFLSMGNYQGTGYAGKKSSVYTRHTGYHLPVSSGREPSKH
ncbi:MAG: patatin-like phospholipase family protein [Desulfobacterales bacterium]